MMASSLLAQQTLVRESLNEDQRTVLAGNVPSLARSANDLGPASDNQQSGSLFLVLGRADQQQRDLDRFAAAASQPGTPQYRNWLTPEQYGAEFGISQADLDTVRAWMEANGLTVEDIPAGRNVIRFSGTMAALRSAFGTEIHRYAVGNNVQMACASEPSIPRALAPVVRGISGLNGVHAHSNLVANRVRASRDTSLGGGSKPAPQFTVYGGRSWGTETYDVNFEPAAGDAAVIYDAPNSFMNSNYSGTAWTGQGVTIGIAGDSSLSSNAITDIARYRALFLNEPFNTAKSDPQLPTVTLAGQDPGENGDQIEALTDVEMVAAMAPKAQVTLYTADSTDLQDGLFLAIQKAINDNNVQVLNISFGACEASLGASGNALIAELYEQAAAQGISITVSTGDNGAAECDSTANSAAAAGLAVNGLASTSWNIAVGGTDFDVLFSTSLSTIEKYITVPGSSSQIAGTSPYFTSALGYIPEVPWNDSSDSFASYASNTPYYYGGSQSITNTYGTEGGMSSIAVCPGTINQSTGTCSGSLAGYAKPAFQSSLAPADHVRDLPDVSFFSGAAMNDGGFSPNFSASWSICSDSSVNGGSDPYPDCEAPSGSTGCGGTCSPSYSYTTVTPVGGTSTAAPLMAGVLALVIQSQGGARLGQADNVLYNLAANHPGDFHDVSAGNNSVLCTTGSPNCGSNNFLTG
jgi:subtilase family serine protease